MVHYHTGVARACAVAVGVAQHSEIHKHTKATRLNVHEYICARVHIHDVYKHKCAWTVHAVFPVVHDTSCRRDGAMPVHILEMVYRPTPQSRTQPALA